MLPLFDANMLIWMFDDGVKTAPVNPDTGREVEHCADRVRYLFEKLARDKATIIVPTPALSEALVHMSEPKRAGILQILQKHSSVRVEPFGPLAAAECAALMKKYIDRHGSLGTDAETNRHGLKYDMQIMAIANIVKATAIYSSDRDLRKLGRQEQRPVIPIWELELPPAHAQPTMFQE